MTTMAAPRGMTFIEAVVAMAVLTTLVGGFAPLLIQVQRFLARSEAVTVATVTARARAESLLSIPWEYDANGLPVATPGLGPSPPDSLDRDTAGHHDRLDAGGRPVERDDETPVVLVRRWAIRSLTAGAIAIEVCVFPATPAHGGSPLVCMATARARQP